MDLQKKIHTKKSCKFERYHEKVYGTYKKYGGRVFKANLQNQVII